MSMAATSVGTRRSRAVRLRAVEAQIRMLQPKVPHRWVAATARHYVRKHA